MTKSKTILAGLGVVAALGVAALPLASYATHPSVSGNVDIYVEVPEAIAMTITGNNDDHLKHDGANTEGAIDVFAGKDTTGSTVATGTVDGHTVSTSTSVNSSSYAILNQNSKVDGADETGGFKSDVTVYTNAGGGYTLTLADADTNTALVNGSYTIPAIITGSADPSDDTSITPGTAAWGYKVKKNSSATKTMGDTWTTDESYSAVVSSSATAATIDSLNVATSGGRKTTILYGVSTATDQAAGVYADTIVYTATAR